VFAANRGTQADRATTRGYIGAERRRAAGEGHDANPVLGSRFDHLAEVPI
jgi:hypothetical protein